MIGGDDGGRTRDLRNAIAALSQLSYVPSQQTSRGSMLRIRGGFVKYDQSTVKQKLLYSAWQRR